MTDGGPSASTPRRRARPFSATARWRSLALRPCGSGGICGPTQLAAARGRKSASASPPASLGVDTATRRSPSRSADRRAPSPTRTENIMSKTPISPAQAGFPPAVISHTFVRLRGTQQADLTVFHAGTPSARVTLTWGGILMAFQQRSRPGCTGRLLRGPGHPGLPAGRSPRAARGLRPAHHRHRMDPPAALRRHGTLDGLAGQATHPALDRRVHGPGDLPDP